MEGREKLEGLKRQELQKLCKENGLKASGTNAEMITRLLESQLDLGDYTAAPTESGEVDEGTAAEESNTLSNQDEKSDIPASETDERSRVIHAETELDGAIPGEATLESPAQPEALKAEAPDADQNFKIPINEEKENPLDNVDKENRDDLANFPDKENRNESLINQNTAQKITKNDQGSSKLNSDPSADPVNLLQMKQKGPPPASRPKTFNPKASAATKTQLPLRKKFDLKESLKRPLSYKPYTGPLKPFDAEAKKSK